ncbi:MAG: YbaB/EbfC family nucleoid-associated protein [Magnetospiraceae bacterium]
MKNFGNLMKQAQQMQTRMQELQDELASLEIEGSAGAGTVKVTLNGSGEARAVRIDPALLDGPEDVGILEDLMVAAINDAKGKVEEEKKNRMAELTGGLQLPPGMKLPF